MCGISGFMSSDKITVDQLKFMNDTMYHRGPNDSGAEIFSVGDYTLGLAQRRLSILELSSLGHQPMHSSDKSISIIFNGEIYNFLEIKKELDYPFISQSDTEVIIASYLKWGTECFSKFNGMFAIALFDHRTGELILARDRIGKKPLYYWYENGNIVFASELKPIMSYPDFKKNINYYALNLYFIHQYIASPHTIFNNVFKVCPGEFIVFKNSNLEKKIYWDLYDTYTKNSTSLLNNYQEAKSELLSLLEKSVEYRLISDVPVGAFLSGGYDSSLVVAIAQKKNPTPLKTYSIGFHEDKFNEAVYAKEIASYLGTDHKEIYLDEQMAIDIINTIPKYYDEPMADSSQIATMLVSELASKDITVVLSGDGGDELFCGYTSYDYMRLAKFLDPIGSMLNVFLSAFPYIRKKLPENVCTIVDNRNINNKVQFPSIRYMNICKKLLKIPFENMHYNDRQKENSNWQLRRMLLDMTTYMTDDICCKVDRASMKHSIESRCPILDYNIVEFSFKISHDFKYHNKIKKYILKDIVYDYIPKELLDRPKSGFAVPIEKWLKTELSDKLIKFSRIDILEKQNIFNPIETQEFIDEFLHDSISSGNKYSAFVWSFYVFQLWYNEYINIL